MPQVTHKPPPLNLRGFHRLWSWLIPVFKVSDEELLLSAGMDALIAIRVISFGILLFLPVTIAALAILVPINYLDDYYIKQGQDAGITDEYTTVFIRLTMSNLTPGTPLLWVHFVFVYGMVFWTCWLITEQYKEYITLRQSYVIRSTALPDGALGGSMGAMDTQSTPLLASRSPMKRQHILARFNSGVRHQLDRQNSAGSSGGGGSDGGGNGSGGKSKVRRSGGSIQLPRRDASASATVPVGGEAFSVVLQHPQQQKVESGGGGGSLTRAGGAGVSRPSRLSSAPILTSAPTFSYHDNTTFEVGDSNQQQQQQEAQHYRTPSSGGGGSAALYEAQYNAAVSASTSTSTAAAPAGPSGEAGSGTLDWTKHDFSQEIVHPNQQQQSNNNYNGHSSNRNVENAALAAAAAAFPPPPPRSPMRNNGNNGAAAHGNSNSIHRVPSFTRLVPQLSGVNPVSRMPSNAAVAAALDPSFTAATAAQALEKIRHHRALSGASVAPKSQSGTPIMSSTPRRMDVGSMTPVQPPSPSHPVGTVHRRSYSSAGGGSGGSGSAASIAAIGGNGGSTTTNVTNNTSGQPPPYKLTPPADLARIIEAVNALAEQQDALDSNGDLPTVTAIAPDFAAPQGQDGIAHRWWSTLSTGNLIKY
jgi:uncharacterized membrane protein YgcG